MVLDLFGGGGGAARGLLAGGFDRVVGVDRVPSRHYPGPLIVADILDLLPQLEALIEVVGATAVWASPPCQRWSASRTSKHLPLPPDLLTPTLAALRRLKESPAANVPWIVENVPPAPMPEHVRLSGAMVGLPIIRDRIFAMSHPPLLRPVYQRHPRGYPYWTITKSMSVQSNQLSMRERNGRVHIPIAVARAAMGIPPGEMTDEEIGEAVPPPYATLLSRFLLD